MASALGLTLLRGVTSAVAADGPSPPPGEAIEVARALPTAAVAEAGPSPVAAPAGHFRHAEGPPPGYTGGFGEPTCRLCHTEFPLNEAGELSVQGLPARYAPGAEYVVTVLLRSEGMTIGGFQGAFRLRDGRPAGRVDRVEGLVSVQPAEDGSVIYVQHAPGALDTGGSPVASWTFPWTAPDIGGGVVSFHVTANSGNGDNSPLGDIVYTASVSIEEDGSAVRSPTGTRRSLPR